MSEESAEAIDDTVICDNCGQRSELHGRTASESAIGECCADYFVYSETQDCLIHNDETYRTMDGALVSRTYRGRHCYYSPVADDWFLSEEARDEYDSEHGESEEESEDEQEQEEMNVYSYHGTTPIRQHGWPAVTPQESLCFGVELEMEHKRDNSTDGQAALSAALGGMNGRRDIPGKYVLERDGSLNDSGVELITCPYTLDFHQKQFGWKELLSPLLKIGRSGKGTESCGMHVHVNRIAISPLTLGKALVFMNSTSNSALVHKIAQRSHNSYAAAQHKTIKDGFTETSGKYEYMHVGTTTVEFRVFKGNLRWDRVLKNIEFCHAVLSYCKDASMAKVENVTVAGDPEGFVAWAIARKGIYPNLVAFIAEHRPKKTKYTPKPAFSNNEDI